MTRRGTESRTTVVKKYRIERADIDTLQRVAQANDLSQQEVVTRLVAFAATVKDDAAMAYVLGLVPRSLKPEARARLLAALEARDGIARKGEAR